METAKYCSRECQYKSKDRQQKIIDGIKALNKGVTKKCVVCSKEFKVIPGRAKTAKCCSLSCAATLKNASRKRLVEKVCKSCKIKFEVQVNRE